MILEHNLGKTKKTIPWDTTWVEVDYVGEVDSTGMACGWGKATKKDDPTTTWEGTFMMDK